MNIVMKIVYATAEAVTITVVAAIPANLLKFDPYLVAWYGLCVALGFVLRLGIERHEKRLSKETLLYHSICTVGWCFFAALAWDYMYTPEKKGFAIYMFGNSVFAAFLVGQAKTIGEVGIQNWIKLKLGKVLAVEEKEIKP